MDKMHKIVITEDDYDVLFLMLTEAQLRLLEFLDREDIFKEDINFHVIKDDEKLFKIV